MRNKKNIRWNTLRITAAGFLGVILLGAMLLYLPVSNTQPIAFIDALFTAVTSVCVTGLVTVVPASQFTLFGKIILLVLIQIGGLGVIACATLFLFLLNRRITIQERVVLKEAYGADRLGGIVKMVKKVILGTFAVEGAGAVMYAFQFIPEYGVIRGIGYSVFHAVSAFCNAGIDILGNNSLADYVTNPIINVTTILLIILSGLGFTVWFDVIGTSRRVIRGEVPTRWWFTRLRLQSKLALLMTGTLLLAGTLFVLFVENGNPETIGGLNPGQKLMASLFQSVTTRTAGFFTVPQGGAACGVQAVLCDSDVYRRLSGRNGRRGENHHICYAVSCLPDVCAGRKRYGVYGKENYGGKFPNRILCHYGCVCRIYHRDDCDPHH